MTYIKHLILSLLILCNITLAYGKATTQSDSPQTVTSESTNKLKPIDIIKNPNILSDKWLDEAIPISQYTDEEKKLQTLINDKTATAVKTYSTASQDKEWVKYDHEAITPYTWKIIDIALTEANGKTNNVSLLRPNWWIRNIGADRLGNRFYLKIPEVAEGDAIVKTIRVNQLDTRLWDEQRNGDYVYRPITATFQHDSNNVLNLYFTNDEKPLGVTPEHRIYSIDKNDFVPAGSLSIGEKVKTYQGISTLVKKEKLEGEHKVYNIEVYRDHNYMVSLNSIVVHNTKGEVYIPEGKFDYFFGRVTSGEHNTSRSLQNKQQLESIGIHDTPQGRQILTETINKSVLDSSNIIKTKQGLRKDGIPYNTEIREMLLTGPGGIRKLEAAYEIESDGTRKLTTIIVKGGGNK